MALSPTVISYASSFGGTSIQTSQEFSRQNNLTIQEKPQQQQDPHCRGSLDSWGLRPSHCLWRRHLSLPEKQGDIEMSKVMSSCSGSIFCLLRQFSVPLPPCPQQSRLLWQHKWHFHGVDHGPDKLTKKLASYVSDNNSVLPEMNVSRLLRPSPDSALYW